MRGIRITEPMTEPPSDMPPPSSLSLTPSFSFFRAKKAAAAKVPGAKEGQASKTFASLSAPLPPSCGDRTKTSISGANFRRKGVRGGGGRRRRRNEP